MLAETGLFVALEGGDGAGKSTQARLLRDRLEAASREVLLTREPGATDVGAQVRRIVLSPETGVIHPRTEALLYAADKSEHVETVVLPALARGTVVVTDRYVDSSLAYQGGGRETLDAAAALEAMLRWATGDLRPHLTVLLDVAPEQARSAGRDRIEAEGDDFHTRVRAHFLTLAAADPEHYLVLDARGEREAIAEQVWARVEALL